MIKLMPSVSKETSGFELEAVARDVCAVAAEMCRFCSFGRVMQSAGCVYKFYWVHLRPYVHDGLGV